MPTILCFLLFVVFEHSDDDEDEREAEMFLLLYCAPQRRREMLQSSLDIEDVGGGGRGWEWHTSTLH